MNINMLQEMVKKDGIVFLTYSGFLSQTLIAGITEALEKEAKSNDLNMGKATNIYTIFIELAQNMMNYSKTVNACDDGTPAEGIIVVSKDECGNYLIESQNIVSAADHELLLPKLVEVSQLSREEIKKKYRMLRKDGSGIHSKGAGIGLYEIAKKCDKIEFTFKEINADRYYFHIKTYVSK